MCATESTGTGRAGSRHADMLARSFSPLLCHLWGVQREPRVHVMPGRHSSPCRADKLRRGGWMLSLLLQSSLLQARAAKTLSQDSPWAEAGENEEACEFSTWAPWDVHLSQTPALGTAPRGCGQCFSSVKHLAAQAGRRSHQRDG